VVPFICAGRRPEGLSLHPFSPTKGPYFLSHNTTKRGRARLGVPGERGSTRREVPRVSKRRLESRKREAEGLLHRNRHGVDEIVGRFPTTGLRKKDKPERPRDDLRAGTNFQRTKSAELVSLSPGGGEREVERSEYSWTPALLTTHDPGERTAAWEEERGISSPGGPRFGNRRSVKN